MPFYKGNRLWNNVISKKTRFKKGQKPWNFGLKKETDERVRNNGLAVGLSLKGKKQSEELIIKRGNYKKEEAAHHWMGDKVEYSGVHQWIRRNLGSAKKYTCKCGKQAKHWANLDHQYKRVKKDYEAMCVKCHSRYDHQMRKLNGKN